MAITGQRKAACFELYYDTSMYHDTYDSCYPSRIFRWIQGRY